MYSPTMGPLGGFVLTELLVVIFIIGILAAVGVPLYTGYVEKTKVSEATSTIGAIITSEKLEKQRNPAQGFYSAADYASFQGKDLDLSDTKYFTYSVAASGGPSANDFVVTATATNEFSSETPAPAIQYTYSTQAWSSTGSITGDMLPE